MDRKPNYTVLEKKIFIDIVKNYSSVVENKKTDNVTTRRKNEAWESITEEYNTSPLTSTQATSKQLRRLWMNLKQRQRDAITKERQYRLCTGGGPARQDAEIDPDIAAITPGLLVEVDNPEDSDKCDNIIYGSVDSLDPLGDIFSTRSQSILDLQSTSTAEHLPTTFPPPPPSQSGDRPLSHPRTSAFPSASQSHPPRPPLNIPSQPLQTTNVPTTIPFQRHKNWILEKEFKERQVRANEMHAEEMAIARERRREAKAKADLAEFLLLQQRRAAGSRTPEDFSIS